jgi:hypothetical protein
MMPASHMSAPLRGIPLALALLAQVACLPWPQRVRVSPEISGYVGIDGTPSINTPVTLLIGPPTLPRCPLSGETVFTDITGHFSVPARRHTFFPAPLLGEHVGLYTLCIGSDTLPAWRRSWVGRAPEREALTCTASDSSAALLVHVCAANGDTAK